MLVACSSGHDHMHTICFTHDNECYSQEHMQVILHTCGTLQVPTDACNKADTSQEMRPQHVTPAAMTVGLATQQAGTCVHEVAKELPASGHLKEGQVLLLRYPVQSSTGGHTTRHTLCTRNAHHAALVSSHI